MTYSYSYSWFIHDTLIQLIPISISYNKYAYLFPRLSIIPILILVLVLTITWLSPISVHIIILIHVTYNSNSTLNYMQNKKFHHNIYLSLHHISSNTPYKTKQKSNPRNINFAKAAAVGSPWQKLRRKLHNPGSLRASPQHDFPAGPFSSPRWH